MLSVGVWAGALRNETLFISRFVASNTVVMSFILVINDANLDTTANVSKIRCHVRDSPI